MVTNQNNKKLTISKSPDTKEWLHTYIVHFLKRPYENMTLFMPTVLYIFHPAGTLCNPVHTVATPPVDCTHLSEDDLYYFKYGEFIT